MAGIGKKLVGSGLKAVKQLSRKGKTMAKSVVKGGKKSLPGSKKLAADVVEHAKRKATAREAVSILHKEAVDDTRRKLAQAAVKLVKRAAGPATDEELGLDALAKIAANIKRERAKALTKAAAVYAQASATGNPERIKKAAEYTAAILTYDMLTKEAVTARAGSLAMRLLDRLSQYGGKGLRFFDRPEWAKTVEAWGKGLGDKGRRVAEMLKAKGTDPDAWKKILADAGKMRELGSAQAIGGGVVGAGGLYGAGKLLD